MKLLDPIYENADFSIQNRSHLWKTSHRRCESVKPNPRKCRLLIPESFTPVKKFIYMVWKHQTYPRKCRLLIPEPFTPMKKFTLLAWKRQTQATKMQTSHTIAVHTCVQFHATTPIQNWNNHTWGIFQIPNMSRSDSFLASLWKQNQSHLRLNFTPQMWFSSTKLPPLLALKNNPSMPLEYKTNKERHM